MHEIKCPSCGKTFKVDETSYAAILAQVHTQEFEEKIVDPSKLKLTAENFLNPLNSLDLQMRAADMLQMDLLARKIFLNLEIDQQKTVLYRYKEPFQTLISGVKTGQITCW